MSLEIVHRSRRIGQNKKVADYIEDAVLSYKKVFVGPGIDVPYIIKELTRKGITGIIIPVIDKKRVLVGYNIINTQK